MFVRTAKETKNCLKREIISGREWYCGQVFHSSKWLEERIRISCAELRENF